MQEAALLETARAALGARRLVSVCTHCSAVRSYSRPHHQKQSCLQRAIAARACRLWHLTFRVDVRMWLSTAAIALDDVLMAARQLIGHALESRTLSCV